jgi:hypothetical protein
MPSNTLKFNYTLASLLAILGSLAAVAVSFGLHLTQDNIHSVLLVVGVVGGTVAAGGGAKDAALIHAQVKLPGWLRFSAATLVAGVGGLLSLVVSFGLHMTQQNIDSLNTLVALVAAGIIAGGAQVTHAAVRAGVHPRLNYTK